MKKMYLVLIGLLSVGVSFIGMENNSFIFTGLSEKELELFNEEMSSGDIGACFINSYNELEEERIGNPHNFPIKAWRELAEVRATLEFIGLGEFDMLNQMKSDCHQKKQQENKERAALSIVLTKNPKAKRRLAFESSSSSEEEEVKWSFVNYSKRDIESMSSDSEKDECDYRLHNHLSAMNCQMIEFPRK
jgi:hypothetical protein